MKQLSSLISGFLLTVNLSSAQVDETPYGYTNFIYQKLLPSGIDMDSGIQVDSSGAGKYIGVPFKPEGGSRFDLYTVKAQTPQAPLTTTYLGTATIDLFTPRTELRVISGDPYNDALGETGPRRTRADEPFSIAATVAGLETNLNRPECFRFINFFHTRQSYLPSKRQVDRGLNPIESLPTRQFARNGTEVLRYMTSLSGLTPEDRVSGACGEERFQAISLEDRQLEGQTIAPRVLDEKLVQVWPCATGNIVGLPNLVRDVVPTIQFNVENTYPLSFTYVQVYPGRGVRGAVGNGRVVLNASYPNTREHSMPWTGLSPVDFNSYFPTDGWWTVEIVTTTPRCPTWRNRIQVAFAETLVNRTITLNTNLTTSE
jgi:hypothetical protein